VLERFGVRRGPAPVPAPEEAAADEGKRARVKAVK
jgi:hypothetical protein